MEQFRRIANLYFLIIGCIMAVGYYTDAFESAISPWTTLGPLAIVLSVSLLQEGYADIQRHRSDSETNNHPCIVLRRSEELEEEGGKRDKNVLGGADVNVSLKKSYFEASAGPNTPSAANVPVGPNFCKIAFESLMRRDIRVGHLVVVRNRDMVPADLILLASSSEGGSAYVETSSIDGETNLKLRTSPHLPRSVLEKNRRESSLTAVAEGDEGKPLHESLEQATKRITRLSALAFPDGTNALDNPANPVNEVEDDDEPDQPKSMFSVKDLVKNIGDKIGDGVEVMKEEVERRRSSARGLRGSGSGGPAHYIAALTSEPPNASVNTYTGKLTLPPVELGGPSIDIPLGADNVLLRGALLRNTEWAIGLSVFTGTDTKLVQNSFETPSKFSKLDKLMNLTVKLVLCVMLICIACLAGLATRANNNTVINLWYLGFNTNTTEPWPYLPEDTFGDLPPKWEDKTPNYAQLFFLYITLLSNFIPLSLYVTVELVTFTMIFLVNWDLDMYHEKTDTRAVARSTNVTDLGQVQYIFSDKTGTLTQNVMRFKRCSVDGMVFGAPVEKARPDAEPQSEDEDEGFPFHPLRQLLVGRIDLSTQAERMRQPSSGLEGLGVAAPIDVVDTPVSSSGDKLTFNAEMFLRVMAICHTVVVEKEFTPNIEDTLSVASGDSSGSGWSAAITRKTKNIFGRKRTSSEMSGPSQSTGSTPLKTVSEHGEVDKEEQKNGRGRVLTYDLQEGEEAPDFAAEEFDPDGPDEILDGPDGPDGAPCGFQYQAESPDEGALVSSASRNFGFQVVGRDSNGVKLSVASPSLLEDENIVDGVKSGTLTPKLLAAETAERPSAEPDNVYNSGHNILPQREPGSTRLETWSILAVNKFDSDRKRMSVVVRSPPELGSIPMLLCKGADSSMLDPKICPEASEILMTGDETEEDVFQKAIEIPKPGVVQRDVSAMTTVEEDSEENGEDGLNTLTLTEQQDEWLMSTILGIQAHLGEFAREGLRTLVLGVRILSEDECGEWLETYKAAATALKNREEKLVAAAVEIERDLHIVGATAIEDKLQRGVPETISTLGKAGIKLWVLTGDKRETAIEIGYSTHVLTNKMHVTEVADGPENRVRTQMAMEFIRLVKGGKLPQYQKHVLKENESIRTWADRLFSFRLWRRRVVRMIRKFCIMLMTPCCKGKANSKLEKLEAKGEADKEEMSPTERHRAVRECADKLIQDWLKTPEGIAQRRRKSTTSNPSHHSADDIEDLSLTSDDLPGVYRRASSARHMLDLQKAQGKLTASDVRSLSLAQVTSQELGMSETPLIDEDVLSLQSFFPGQKTDETSDFDRRKRTLLERVFAVDSDVRHGRLVKHLKKEKKEELAFLKGSHPVVAEEVEDPEQPPKPFSDRPRALVIEGHALLHLLGDPLLEEILFGVASSCDAVIACRVSPKQKALIVKLVRHNVSPEPTTLAIGDGANDVGMIQEAHVGVGISGLEGKQAVNAADFAIAQFRYLEELLLIHGRWNFFRQSTVVLFSFYKNACMAGCIIVYSGRTLYSGTPLFDEWVLASLNFVAGAPILFLGMFDRCLEKDYVRKNPEVYSAGRNNELITLRTIFRWLLLTVIHIFTLYYFSVPPQILGGGMTSAWEGLMGNESRGAPGDGEGADLKSVGTVTFTNLIILLALKVLYESKSIIQGKWPAWWCRNKNEGFFDRLAYTWVGVTWFSILFYLFFLYVYQLFGRAGTNLFSPFVDTTNHVLHTRSLNWMVILLVPTLAISFDVTGKLFSNTFYPTQTQIHLEIAAKEHAKEKKRKRRGEQAVETPTASKRSLKAEDV